MILKLPCRDKIKTICSDDDLALDSAFHMILESGDVINEYDEEESEYSDINENDTFDNNEEEDNDDEDQIKQKIQAMGRVICFWHKISNFKKFLNSVKIENQQKVKAINCFKKIGFSRDIKYVNLFIEELKEIDDKICEYFEKNIEPKLQYMTKSYIQNEFTCGYITFSIAESTNSKIKRKINGSALTLVDMRKTIDSIQFHEDVNDYYIKAQKKTQRKKIQ